MPRSRAVLAAVAVVAAISGCEGEDDDIESVSEDLTQTLTLRFELADGDPALKSSGRRLACTERFQGLDGERVTCSRDGERLQVIVKDTGKSVVAIRDMGGKRGYYACAPSGDVEGVPAHMKCNLTTLRPRGTGGLSSPFDSSVDGISVPNTHWVDDRETVLRGMEPRTPAQFAELRAAGVERVVIFKNMTGGADAKEEIEAWGLSEGDVLHVPFEWKDLDGFTAPCEETLEALRFIAESEAAGEKVYFHCTVGEDRTGYLAALYSLLYEEGDPRGAFEDDMCEHGYGSGNPQKPGFVLGKLEDGLSPLYRMMAFLVESGDLTKDLEADVCAAAPVVPDDFMAEPMTCGVSTTLVP